MDNGKLYLWWGNRGMFLMVEGEGIVYLSEILSYIDKEILKRKHLMGMCVLDDDAFAHQYYYNQRLTLERLRQDLQTEFT